MFGTEPLAKLAQNQPFLLSFFLSCFRHPLPQNHPEVWMKPTLGPLVLLHLAWLVF